ncbi:MAG: hypothetical protein IPP42_20695 [Saprospiraceae bacterium]|nr:hypothetical protein [Saprospiraceae bacterium]
MLYSESLDKYYSGITSDPVSNRLLKHNSNAYGTHFTSKAQDWIIKLELEAADFAHARRMELYVKKRKSRIYIEELINHISPREKLLLLTRKSSVG